MSSPHSRCNIHQSQPQNPSDNSLDLAFDKMEKLGIPADIFGNINPNWRFVMKNYFDHDKLIEQKVEQDFQNAIQKLQKTCHSKYQSNPQKVEDCLQQAQLRVANHFRKPKELSQIILCSFANKCLIRGNSIQFCTEEVLKQKNVINSQCLKKLQGIAEYL